MYQGLCKDMSRCIGLRYAGNHDLSDDFWLTDPCSLTELRFYKPEFTMNRTVCVLPTSSVNRDISVYNYLYVNISYPRRFGFNVGSLGSISNQADLAAKVAVNTALAGAAGGCTAILIKVCSRERRDVVNILNGACSASFFIFFCFLATSIQKSFLLDNDNK